jgi:hypothetical protein
MVGVAVMGLASDMVGDGLISVPSEEVPQAVSVNMKTNPTTRAILGFIVDFSFLLLSIDIPYTN